MASRCGCGRASTGVHRPLFILLASFPDLATLLCRNQTMKLHFLVFSFVLCRLGATAFVCRPAKTTLLAAEVPAISSRDFSAFTISGASSRMRHRHARRTVTALSAENKVAALVSGEELEKMLGELDQPLVVDAYATW
jgi:hypothetical protein